MKKERGLLKSEKRKRRFLTSKTANFIFTVAVLSIFVMAVPTFAAGADALNAAKGLLSKGAQAGGGLIAVWGLVSLGLSIKDHNGPGIQGAVMQIVGGGMIVAAGTYIGTMDLTIAP